MDEHERAIPRIRHQERNPGASAHVKRRARPARKRRIPKPHPGRRGGFGARSDEIGGSWARGAIEAATAGVLTRSAKLRGLAAEILAEGSRLPAHELAAPFGWLAAGFEIAAGSPKAAEELARLLATQRRRGFTARWKRPSSAKPIKSAPSSRVLRSPKGSSRSLAPGARPRMSQVHDPDLVRHSATPSARVQEADLVRHSVMIGLRSPDLYSQPPPRDPRAPALFL